MEVVTVYTTVSTEAEAHTLAAAMVAERWAACANVLPGLHSYYHWEGQLQTHQPEVAILFKTRLGLLDDFTQRLKQLHPYTLPCIVAWPIAGGLPEYLAWVKDEVLPPTR